MALTDQPYLPLYVDDWMNNSKLKLCSPGAHGLMISIMCLMHKSDSYGTILLKQKFKQTDKQELNFASQIAKLTTFDLLEIEPFFYELIEEKVLKIEGDYLMCTRMVKDASISKKRASSGKSGGEKTQESIKNFAKANIQPNTVIENVNESENENEVENVNESEKKIKSTKFQIPKIEEIQAYCEERGNNINSKTFFNFYESKNWIIGKNKMKDWKACIRTWETNSDKTEKNGEQRQITEKQQFKFSTTQAIKTITGNNQ